MRWNSLTGIRHRRKALKLKITAMATGLMLLTSAAIALPPMLKVFETNYKPAKNGKLVKAKCAVCHVANGKTALNAYGKDLKEKLGESKTLTPEILKSVEAKDSDGDGASNIDEIKADTLPGDAKSKPAGK